MTTSATKGHEDRGGACPRPVSPAQQEQRSPHLPPSRPANAPAYFHVLAKPTGSACNLACKYCFFLAKEEFYPGSGFRMSDELLETYIRQYTEGQAGDQVTIAWQGGEPTLMGLDFYRRSVALAARYARPGMRIEHTIQTNGTQLNDEWCAFFREHNFLVGLSIDGPRPLHDAYRVDKGGGPTLPRLCRECPVRFACHGECPKNRFIETPDGEPGLNYLCAGYKAFFTHIDGPMRIMAQLYRAGREPAEIMPMLAEWDARRQAAFAAANRNDACPCGSGKKYKHCHGANKAGITRN